MFMNTYIFFNVLLPSKIKFLGYTFKYFPNNRSPSKFREIQHTNLQLLGNSPASYQVQCHGTVAFSQINKTPTSNNLNTPSRIIGNKFILTSMAWHFLG